MADTGTPAPEVTAIAPAPEVIAIVPARFAASRFPGKLLATLHGRTILSHVISRARLIRGCHRLVVATDDDRILEEARRCGAECVMTASHHRSGSDRMGEALDLLGAEPDFVLNIQGDEPLLDPPAIEGLIADLRTAPDAIWTLAVPIESPAERDRASVVKVARARDGRALYFSRAPVPFVRDESPAGAPYGLRHIGVYGYPLALLRSFLQTAPSPLEVTEGLEQLRALESGMTIRVRLGGWPQTAVDTPEDLAALQRAYPTPASLPGPGAAD